ncbi:zinc finger protein hangover isoform X1 [Drosophila suzukii]|uniref:Zinc finger protein hangover isoform X1 n=1 Tax=Drosophila suzukii TaxID=28584 RepID=A0AB40ACB7_DROSZ
MCDAAAATTATAAATATTTTTTAAAVAALEATATPGTAAVTGTGAGNVTGTASPEATGATPAATKGERSARQNCCRLCIAPQTECISIINSYAADKEPLSTKIHNCVGIKITPQDRLSLQICHACISYLNSWQSFKNRCFSSQTKQRQWLDVNKSKLLSYLDLNSAENGGGGSGGGSSYDHLQQHQQQQQPSENELEAEKATPTASATAANILDGIHSLKKRKSLTVYPLPAIPIKDEPIDTDDDYQMKSIDESDDMVDPTMFLERSEHEGDVPLTASDYDYTAQHGVNASSVAASLPPNAVANVAAAGDSKVASCRACSLQFSTRANARRHERNLHPNLFQLSTDSPHNTPITKPTPALAAALEIQRAAAAAATAEANRAAGAAGGNISTQKYRQVVMNAFIKCEGGGYDYDNPEQYRPLLTRDKVEFIEQNDEFLEQYQTMTCRCCSKYFSTYKNFMAHVRKKYPLLPRNLCFNCLKMNDSKALFISHLKKRNCINLFRVLNALRGKTTAVVVPSVAEDVADDVGTTGGVVAVADAGAGVVVTMTSPTVTVSGGGEAVTPGGGSERPEKLRAKELLVNKLYECKLCPKGFRTKHEFRTHVYDKHADVQRKDNNSIQCSFCGLDFADPVDRRRHYNNMDCIVRLRCMTCDAKLETHQRFLDHVYQDHLGGVGGGGASSDNASTTGSGMARSNSMEHSPGKRSLLGALGIGVGSSADESRSSSAAPPLTSTPKLAGVAQVGGSGSGGGGGLASASASAQSSANRDASAPKSQYFSRMPQVCPICGQQYNNYNNVLRHMESKHPNKLPETYKCVRCGLGYPRISYLREHMINVHGVDKNRHSGGFEYIVNADAVKLADGSTPNVYTGRYDYVMKDLMSITNGGTLDDEEEEPGSVAKKMRLDDSSNNSSLVGVASQQKECPICNAVFSNNIGLSNHMRSHYTASNAVNAALAAANRMTPKSLTITATPAADSDVGLGPTTSVSAPVTPAIVPPAMANQTPQEQAVFRRSLDQAADRRFRRMRCRICQRRFSSKKSYRYHMLTDHQVQNVQFIKCKLCNAEFAYEKGLKVHLFKVHGRAIKDEMIIKQFECEVCSIVYSSELELAQHKRSVHKLASASASASTSASTSSKVDDDSLMEEAKPTAADLADLSTLAASASTASASGQVLGTPLYWYQCKYCPSNFNTNKKLAIHINSHDEFDSNDYSCKDCGNVYSGRKSLWVHRYKKHPQVPDPAECSLCRKVFFDRQMHDNHTPTCNRKPITSTGAHQQQDAQLQQQQASLQPARRTVFRHKTGDDEDEEEDDDQQQQQLDERANNDGNGTVAAAMASSSVVTAATSLKIRIPEVACTICGARFTDQEHFSKHIQKHEQELYVDNPLAAMFDDGPADAGQFQLERQNENGEYACDLCAKTFPQVIALKVHRKWHFRGDSKQNPIDGEATQLTNNNHTTNNNNNSMLHLRELHAVGLMPNQQQQQQQQSLNNSCNSSSMNHNNNSSSGNRSKSMKRKRELKCEYCASTFISNNNLRRHMYELHKHEVSNLPEPPVIVVDDHLTCRRCQLKFDTKELWIEHKLADAKVVRPFCPFQWGCDLCGEYLSRKEKLMNHINNHLKEEVIVPVATKAAIERTAAMEAAASEDATTAAAPSSTALGEAAKTEEQSLEKGEVAAAGAAAAAATTAAEKMEEDSDDLDEDDSSGEEEESSGTGDDEDDDTDDEDGEGEDDDEDEEGDGGEGEDEEGVQPPAQLLPSQKQHKANLNQDDDDLVEQIYSTDEDDEDDGEVESDDDDEDDDEEDDVEEPEPVALPVRPLMNGKSKMPPLIVASSDEEDDGVIPIEDIIEEEFDEDVDPDPDPDDVIEEVDDDDLDEGDAEDEPNVVSTASSSESESTTTTTSNSHSHTHSTGERRKKADDQLNDPGFTCDLCQLCFDSQELLQSHIKSHILNGPKLSTAAAAQPAVATAVAATAAATATAGGAAATLATAAKTKPDSKSAVLANNNNNKSKTVAATTTTAAAAKAATTN